MNDHISRTAIACVGPVGGAIVGLLLLAVTPPARGEMLLLPLDPHARTIHLARDHGALLVATTDAGRTIVHGERAALFWPMLRAGVLAVATPRLACGTAR